jgi:L-seryl-tRNA(Ser) seleniumtransferase
MMNKKKLRAIPAVERVVQALGPLDLPRPAVVALVRRQLASLRGEGTIGKFDAIVQQIRSALDSLRRSRIQPVINGTGILIHTNLGRAPLGQSVVETLSRIAASYNNLEYDLTSGERGSRAAYLEQNLAILCGAEAATVTNNCAASLLLILRHFTAGARKEVIISRGELVQIGGGFRIPEILETSGATLREIGTTNKTSLDDYSRAVHRGTALLLKVHRSNFFMGGFVESPAPEQLAALARQKGLPFVEDLGSGAVVHTEKVAAIEHEPTPAEVLRHGVDLACFSGDKLLGGPQAGIIAGRAKLITALKREPFFRALRCDKLILSVLQSTVDLYLSGAEDQIPVLELLRMTTDEMRMRAEKITRALAGLSLTAGIGEGKAQVGGGSLPRSLLNSVTLELRPRDVGLAEFARRLRMASPPVLGYVSSGRYNLDLRTIFPRQDEELVRVICAVI